MTPFSPQWWALWTWELTRPGLFDDEEPPPEAPQPGVWSHYPPWLDAHGHDRGVIEARPAWDRRESVSPYDPRARRPAWPAIVAGQTRGDPAETDGCRLHDGRCSEGCVR